MGEVDLIGQLVDKFAAETDSVGEASVRGSGASILEFVVVDKSFHGAVLLLTGLALVTVHARVNLC